MNSRWRTAKYDELDAPSPYAYEYEAERFKVHKYNNETPFVCIGYHKGVSELKRGFNQEVRVVSRPNLHRSPASEVHGG